MILEILPDNLITPFTTGNCLQVMFLGVIIGIVMLLMPEKVRSITGLLDQLSSIIQVIISVILMIAMPPVPGSGAVTFTVLISQMGLPTESIGVAMTLLALVEFVSTSGDVLCRTYSLIPSAGDFGMLDMEIFRKP